MTTVLTHRLSVEKPFLASSWTRAELQAETDSPRSGASQKSAARGWSPEATPCLSVLVVDDNHDAATTLASLLEMLGHSAESVFTAEQALEALEAHHFDLAVCDIGLPRTDGYQLAQTIRERSEEPPVLVALTGYGGVEHRRRSQQAGFREHILKPIGLPRLQSLLATVARERGSSSDA